MACGLALKRPHEYDSYLGEDSYSNEAKRARHSAPHCTRFRPQMGTVAASLPSTSSFAQRVNNRDSATPFASVVGCQLTSSQLGAYLRSEIKSLKRRKLIPKRSLNDAGRDEEVPAKIPVDYRTPKSPSHSGSDSEGEGAIIKKNQESTPVDEKPHFTLKQVQLICERLLKEQEMRLRQEYETALNQRLDEQHQQYVQFAEEQLALHHREKSNVDLSYLS